MQRQRRSAWAEIDLNAIQANIKAVKSLLPAKTRFMAVVKANAYGHGLLPVAKAALKAGADRLGVAVIDAALALRRAGVKAPIQILSEVNPEETPFLIENNIIATIGTRAAAAALADAAQKLKQPGQAELKVDTGMHRLGVDYSQAVEFYNWIKQLKYIEIKGCLTHFACADQVDSNFTQTQLKRFLSLREKLTPEISFWHAANSAGALFWPESRLDMVRVGIAMYGLQPSTTTPPIKLQPAMSLKVKMAGRRRLDAGEGVSYGWTYRASKPVTVAILPIGYGDGYSRRLSNRAWAELQSGQKARLIGNICMDQLLIELPDGYQPQDGETVTLIGDREGIRAENIAALLGTINYEVVCRINERVPRVYV